MARELKCDVCNGTDYSELNTCYICNRNYCEICEGANSSINMCELCVVSDVDDND